MTLTMAVTRTVTVATVVVMDDVSKGLVSLVPQRTGVGPIELPLEVGLLVGWLIRRGGASGSLGEAAEVEIMKIVKHVNLQIHHIKTPMHSLVFLFLTFASAFSN